ncbi:MAG: hypothetical protein ACFCBU_01750, partial [Cyanophyceae cyanobacterium]
EWEALSDVSYMELVYEDDLEQSEVQQKTVDTVLEHLGLASRKAKAKYKKVNRQSMEDLIINYDEFRECVIRNEWDHFLD